MAKAAAKNQAIATFTPRSEAHWREWLIKHHQSKQAVWLILYKQHSGKPSIRWTAAVDHALCYGWIDGTRRPLDSERFLQFFSKRKPRGTWSKVNKAKIVKLIEEGRMTQAGLNCIEAAKLNGSWEALDEVEELVVPKDLARAFRLHPGSKQYYLSLSKSVRKQILLWVALAKRAETRERRINEIAELAARKQKPKHIS